MLAVSASLLDAPWSSHLLLKSCFPIGNSYLPSNEQGIICRPSLAGVRIMQFIFAYNAVIDMI